MLFGKKKSFAIEVDIDKNFGNEWIFGKCCYWINGRMVGKYDEGTSLRDVLFQMKYILGDSGKRLRPGLLNLEYVEVIKIAEEIEEFDGANQMWSEGNLPGASINVRIPVDVFDEWKIYLIDGKVSSRLIARNIFDNEVVVSNLIPGEFDSAFSAAYRYIDEFYNKEISE